MSDLTIETTLLRGRVTLLQPRTGFHASPDTVFLAAAAVVRERYRILDIGCGVGSAGLCVALKNPTIQLFGIDIQQNLIDLSLQNAALNGVQDRCRFFQGDLLSEKNIPDNAFHSVLMNPPYQDGGSRSPHPIKALAHDAAASGAGFEAWARYAHRKLKNGGHLTLIHRADRLDQIAATLTHRRWFGSLDILPLHPRAGTDAKRVIIRARKERYAPARLRAGLVLHNADGSYTAAAEEVLSQGGGL